MRPELEELRPRICPDISFHGGPLPSPLHIVNEVEQGNPYPVDSISKVAASQLLGLIAQHYAGVQPAVVDATLPIAYDPNFTLGTAQQIAGNTGVNRIVFFWLAPGHEVLGGGGIHGWDVWPGGTTLYAVVDGQWSLQNESVIGAHEIAEAGTDPTGGGYFDNGTGQEIMDILEFRNDLFFTLGGYTFSAPADAQLNPILPGPQPTTPLFQYVTMLLENAELFVFSLAARLNPAFAPYVQGATLALGENPATSTPLGQQLLAAQDAAFVSLLAA